MGRFQQRGWSRKIQTVDELQQRGMGTPGPARDRQSNILAMCCEVISSFVIFAVLDLRVGGCRP